MTQAASLWRYLNTFPDDIPKIVAGDMNTYFDFDWPVELLTEGFSSLLMNPYNPCFQSVREEFLQHGAENYTTLIDVWEENYPISANPSTTRWWAPWLADGNTFSTFGNTDSSRPDRIYYTANEFACCDVVKFGGESFTYDGKISYPSDHMGVLATFEHVVPNKKKKIVES